MPLPADLQAVEDALARWAGTATGYQPVWADQNVPMPSPAAGLVVITYTARWRGVGGAQPSREVVSTGLLTAEARIGYPVEAAVSLKVVGPDAPARALALELALRDQDAWEPVKTAGLAWTGELTRLTVPEVLGALRIDMEVLDIRLRSSFRVTRPQGWIETSSVRAVEVDVDGLVHFTAWT